MMLWLKRWWATDVDLQRARALDDRLLADIGIDRATLEDRVRGRAINDPDSRTLAKAVPGPASGGRLTPRRQTTGQSCDGACTS